MRFTFAHACVPVVLLAAACAAKPPATVARSPLVPAGEVGQVIASASMAPVPEDKLRGLRGTDCSGPGLDVTVDSSTAQKRYLFDSEGKPCTPSVIVYDGNMPAGQRGGSQGFDPAVGITFHDKLGPLNSESIKPAPVLKVTTEAGIVGVSTTEPRVSRAERDRLVATLNSWQEEHKRLVQKHLERDKQMADEAARQIAKAGKAESVAEQEKQVTGLLGELRHAERQLQSERQRHQITLEAQSAQNAQTQATLQRWQADEDDLKAQLEATQRRLAEVESLSQQLAADNANQRKNYQSQMVAISSELKSAEEKALQSRQELIFAAAKKIAEADQLARAARLAEADAKAREAARLKAEAEDQLNQALDLTADGRPRGLPNPADAPQSLADVPVVVHQKSQPLDVIVSAILAQARKQAGAWKADWQLSKNAQYILQEKWSLTAEAPVRLLLQNLTTQVKNTHNINLKFTQFGQSRLLVITDE